MKYSPKVIWIRRVNCSTKEIKALLDSNMEKVLSFISDATNGILTFY